MTAQLDLKLLHTFVTIAAEGTLSAAADALHLSQPAVSRQLRNLERDVGQQLVVRSNSTVTLTEAGALLYERAHTLLHLAESTLGELTPSDTITGTLRIGAAESRAFSLVARAAKNLHETHPSIQVSVHSGGGRRVADGIARGEFSFGLFIEPWDLSPYRSLQLPLVDHWGILAHKDSPLAHRTRLSLDDLEDVPLVVPETVMTPSGISHWLGSLPAATICGTYNLLFNASIMVEEGLCAALCIGGISGNDDVGPLRFIPLYPAVTSRLHLAWLSHHRLTQAESVFLDKFREVISHEDASLSGTPVEGSQTSDTRPR
ncbi:LysR family transcriptional regulator [Arcanobacterium haemolyticum]|nr:LysR family transcriptional regulator [Arcanobacterium haemolyticum]